MVETSGDSTLKGLPQVLDCSPFEMCKGFTSSVPPEHRLSTRQVLGLLETTSKGLAIAILTTLPFVVTCRAATAQDTPAPGRAIVEGPVIVGGKGATIPSPGSPAGPGAVNPLSERAQRIKKGLATTVAPGASPIPGAPPSGRAAPGPSSKFNGESPARTGTPAPGTGFQPPNLGQLSFEERFVRDWTGSQRGSCRSDFQWIRANSDRSQLWSGIEAFRPATESSRRWV